MGILAGCDYVSSIPGIGIKHAHALVSAAASLDVDRLIRKLRFEGHYQVPKGYETMVKQARACFCHQRVWDPRCSQLVHLHPLLDKELDGSHLGPKFPQPLAQGVAKGVLHPESREPFRDLMPNPELLALYRLCYPPGGGASGCTGTKPKPFRSGLTTLSASTKLDQFFVKSSSLSLSWLQPAQRTTPLVAPAHFPDAGLQSNAHPRLQSRFFSTGLAFRQTPSSYHDSDSTPLNYPIPLSPIIFPASDQEHLEYDRVDRPVAIERDSQDPAPVKQRASCYTGMKAQQGVPMRFLEQFRLMRPTFPPSLHEKEKQSVPNLAPDCPMSPRSASLAGLEQHLMSIRKLDHDPLKKRRLQ